MRCWLVGLGFIGYGLLKINRHTRPDPDMYEVFTFERDENGKAKIVGSERDAE